MKGIQFESSSLFSKWAKPRIFGSGDLYNATMATSREQTKRRGPALTAYNPLFAAWLGSKLDKYHNPSHLTYQRDLVGLEDGGMVAVDAVTDSTATPNPALPNILHLPGGGMHTFSPRTRRISDWFLQAGFPAVYIANRRGCCNVPLYTPRISLFVGEYNDTAQVVEHLVEHQPNKKWILIGSSSGAAQALDYLSKASSDRDQIIGGVFDSVMFNGARWLDTMRNDHCFTVQKTVEINVKLWSREALRNPANDEVRNQVAKLVDKDKFLDSKIRNMNRPDLVNLLYDGLLSKLCHDSSLPLHTPEEFHMHAFPYYTNATRSFMNIKKPVVMVISQDDKIARVGEDDVNVLMENPDLCLWMYAGGAHMRYTSSYFPYHSFLREVYLENVNLLTALQLQS